MDPMELSKTASTLCFRVPVGAGAELPALVNDISGVERGVMFDEGIQMKWTSGRSSGKSSRAGVADVISNQFDHVVPPRQQATRLR